MHKRFVYIVLLLIFAQCIPIAAKAVANLYRFAPAIYTPAYKLMAIDTLIKKQKQQQEDEKKKIKEISKAKRQVKPEKIDDDAAQGTVAEPKPKRLRRPEGLERPPEIPRRNEN